MSDTILLELTNADGTVERARVSRDATSQSSRFPSPTPVPKLFSRQLVDLSDNIAELPRMTSLLLHNNSFAKIPAGILAMSQLNTLNVRSSSCLFCRS